MRVRILGPLEVEDESGRAVELGRPKQRALLALLAINPNSELSTDRIIDELWGDQPPSDGPRNVRVYVSRLREVLEPDRPKRAPGRLIVTEASGYALRIDPENIDARRFERLIGEARGEMADDLESARQTVDEALGLWRDRPLAGLAFEEFAQSEIRRLEELHLSALELRFETSIRLFEHSSVIPELEKLVTEHPLRERIVGLLMEALAGSGRQTEALRAYRSLELRLANEVGLEPSVELRRLEERILLQQEQLERPAPQTAESNPVGSLPARLTSLVGREHDLDEIAGLLEGTRLLTLTGAGGVGKTSLAIEAVRNVAAQYSGRVWLVDFSPLRDSTGVTAAVADALGVEGESGVPLQSAIAAALGRKRILLLLDNCEHVVDAVASLVLELLQAVPELSIICASRRSLGVDGESVYGVAPLGIPPATADVGKLRDVASSRLLSQRAAAVSPGFEITIENAADVATICRRLNGIPLPIELAASNLRCMTIREVAECLRDRLSLGGRQRGVLHHRTLRATLQWSYDLLEEAERALFDRLSVFAGRFSRAAALAIGTGRDGVPPSAELAALVDASMIVADVTGRAASYKMLLALRDFGLLHLRERGELESVRRAHAEYLAADAEEMGLQLVPLGPTKRIERNASVDDFRAAADWALQAGLTELATHLYVPLSHHWINGGHLAEAAHWMGRVNQLGGEESLVRWRLQFAVAIYEFFAGRNEKAEAAFRSLSASALQIAEPAASADALQFVGRVRWRRGDLRGGRDDMAAAAEVQSDRAGRAKLYEGLAVLELLLGNIAAAQQQADLLTAFADGNDDPMAACNALNVRGWLACYRGNLSESIRCFEQCRGIAIDEGDWDHDVNARLGLAWVFPALGLPDQALAQAKAALELSVDAGNWGKHVESMILMGGAQLDLGDLPRAAHSVAEGLEILRDHTQRVDHMLRGIRFAGWIALASGRSDLAIRFMTVVEAQHRRIGYVDSSADAARSAHALTEAGRMLGETERDALTRAAVDAPLAEVLNEAVDYLSQVSEDLATI
jgi:predicted ATPase/DNA-binding SARP family transcriptional activator